MCEAVILLVHNKLNSLSSYRKFPPRALEFQLNNGISGVDESKNELKTIVSTKIENISEYLRHLNTEPVYLDTSKLNRGFFASENRKIFPCFLLHLFTFKRREKKGGSTSLQYIFSTDCTIFPKLETRYTSLPWTRTKKPWVCTTIFLPFAPLVVGPSPQFLSIKID